MPNQVDDFNQSMREAGPLVTEITKAFNKASEATAKFDADLKRLESRIETLKAKEEKLGGLSRQAGIAGYRRDAYLEKKSTVSEQRTTLEETQQELRTRKQATIDVAPDTEILKSAKAVETYITKIEKLISELTLLAQQPGMETQVKKLESQINRSITMMNKHMLEIQKYRETISAPLPGGLGGMDGGPFGPDDGGRAPTQRMQQYQDSFFGADPVEQERRVNRALEQAYRERKRIMDQAETDRFNSLNAGQQQREMAMVAEANRENRLRTTLQDPSGRWVNAYKIAQEKGYSASDISDIKQSGLSGIEQVSFRGIDNITGARKELKLFTDEAGRVLPSTTRQFSNFASSVGRDFRELAKWTIAIGLIYGPMRKLQELTKLMIENEVRLADASIAVSDSTLKMGDIFDIASDAANAMGENVSDVIVNFSQAYQATGGLGSAMERTAVATKLMSDALILSKLSTLSASESIDILAAALRQGGTGLDGGTKLLDQWVKVSTQAANVSLDTLATGFSVLGEAASAAGLSNEQLTAILAVTSETMGVTGKEAANMARSFVAGFQSDKATAALEAVGISTKTVTGEMRTLLQIQADLYNASRSGTISEDTYSKLTLAIGGGTRRQAPTAAFIQQAGRIDEIVAAQEDAGGAAAEALAKQLDTVQTSMTRLQNGMQSLAQSLGDEGGLLGVFQAVLDLLTMITRAADRAFEAMGKAGPVLAMALTAGAIIKQQGPLWKSNLATGAGLAAINVTGSAGAGTFVHDVISRQQTRPDMSRVAPGGMLFAPGQGQVTTTAATAFSREAITGVALSATLAAIGPIIQNLSNADKGIDRFGGIKAGADATGALIGAAIGNSLGGPIAGFIGASVGQAIAEAFVNTATKDLSILLTEGGATVYGKGAMPEAPATTAQEVLGGGSIDQMFASWTKDLANIFVWAFSKDKASEGMAGHYITTEEVLYKWATPEKRAEIDKFRAEQIATGKVTAPAASQPFTNEQAIQQEKYGSYIDTKRRATEQDLLDQLIKGKISPTAYSGKMETLTTFKEQSTRYYTAFGEDFEKISSDINSAEDAYSAFLEVFTYGSSEQIASLTNMVTGVADLTNTIELLKAQNTADSLIKIPELEGQKADLQAVLANSMNAMYKQLEIDKNPVLSLYGKGDQLKGDIGAVYKDAASMESTFLKSTQGWTDEQISMYREGLTDFVLALDESGELVYKKISEFGDVVGGDWWEKAVENALANGTIDVEVKAEIPGLQSYDVTQSQYLKAMEGYDSLAGRLKEAGYTPKESELVQLFSGGEISFNKKDWSIVAILLQKMLETEQKQLEQGMWNIPDGATFWVPVTSLTPANQIPGEDTAFPMDVENTNATSANTVAVIANTAALLAEGIDPITGKETPEHLDYRRREYEAQGGGVIVTAAEQGTPHDTEFLRTHGRAYSTRIPTTKVADYTAATGVPHFSAWYEEFIKNLPAKKLYNEYEPIKPVPIEKPLGALLSGAGVFAGAGLPNFLSLFAGIFGGIREESKQLQKVDIQVDSRVQLMVDGRILATVIKPYLLADILRATAVKGATKRII